VRSEPSKSSPEIWPHLKREKFVFLLMASSRKILLKKKSHKAQKLVSQGQYKTSYLRNDGFAPEIIKR
jgi:hypothetical protein